MKLSDAIQLRDEWQVKLIGKNFEGNSASWRIRDVIVATSETVDYVYKVIWNEDRKNETVLKYLLVGDNEYDVFVISDHWPYWSCHVIAQRLEEYRLNNL